MNKENLLDTINLTIAYLGVAISTDAYHGFYITHNLVKVLKGVIGI